MNDSRTNCFVCSRPIFGSSGQIRGEPAHRKCVEEFYIDRRGRLDPFEGLVLIAIASITILLVLTLGWWL